MKKYKKPLALAITAFSLISLASCGSVTAKENFILEYTYTSPDGTKSVKQITADDMFERYLKLNPGSHAQAYYDALNEIKVRVAFEDENGLMNEFYDEIKSDTDKEVRKSKDTADDNSQSWDEWLNENGYDDPSLSTDEKEKQFRSDKEYEFMKEKIDDEYYETFNTWQNDSTSDPLQQKYNLVWGEDGYIENRLPYNVKHILVKIGSSTDEFTRSEVTESNVSNLVSVVNELVDSNPDNTFDQIAKIWTEDPGISSNPNGYIMDTNTTFVEEFQLGVYTYETLITTNNEKQLEAKNKYKEKNNDLAFNIPGYNKEGNHTENSVAEYLSDLGVAFVPYGAIAELDEYKSIETYNGQSINEGNSAYFPRNIIFNKYFNRHNLAFIVNEDIKTPEGATVEEFTANGGNQTIHSDGKTSISDLDENGLYQTSGTKYYTDANKTKNFRSIQVGEVSKDVLCDNSGNPIMMVVNATSSGGIHFITIERSSLIDEAYEVRDDITPRKVSLAEYFAPENPLNSDQTSIDGKKDYNLDFPGVDVDGEATGTPKMTYVYSRTATDYSGYESIIDADGGIKEKYETFQDGSNGSSGIKDIKINDWLFDGKEITIKAVNEDINKLITTYEEKLELSYERAVADALKDKWESYANTLKNQERERLYGLIPETCALHFGETEYYKEGGICNYSSSKNPDSGTGDTNGSTEGN